MMLEQNNTGSCSKRILKTVKTEWGLNIVDVYVCISAATIQQQAKLRMEFLQQKEPYS